MSVIDKWFGIIYYKEYRIVRDARLYVGRIKHCFLNDEDGCVVSVELMCLPYHSGSDPILKDWPIKAKNDCTVIPPHDVICGPLTVVPIKGGKWKVDNYQAVLDIFNNCPSKKIEKQCFHPFYKCF